MKKIEKAARFINKNTIIIKYNIVINKKIYNKK